MGNARRAASVLLLVALLAAPCAGAQAQAPAKAAQETETSPNARLAGVKRVCVQPLGDDAISIQVREMVIAKLFESRRFSLTENCDKADFVLKGTVTERSDRAFRSETESIGARTSVSGSESERSGAARTGTSASASAGLDSRETLTSSEAKQQAAVTLRLVDKDGEILWAFSSESTGGKTKGAIGDAADRAVARLLRDIQRAEKQAQSNRRE
jgi:hypothetical protein